MMSCVRSALIVVLLLAGNAVVDGQSCYNGVTCSTNADCTNPTFGIPPRFSFCNTTGLTPLFSGGPISGACCMLPPATTDPASAAGPCNANGIQGACQAGYTCNLPADPANGKCFPAFDPNLSDAIGPALNGQCPVGYVAMTSATADPPEQCFPLSDVPGLCAKKDQIGSCTNSECPRGYYCNTYADTCCQVKTTAPFAARPHHRRSRRSPVMSHLDQYAPLSTGTCPTGYTVLAGVTPVNSICPKGATNYNNAGTCCALTPATTTPAFTVGSCDADGIQGACPAGYACNLLNDPTNGECFPAFDPNLSDPIRPAFNGQCPVGYVAMTVATADPPNQCFPLSNVPGLCAKKDQIGQCTNSGCMQGYYCNTYADVCCQVTTTAPFAARPHRRPSRRSPVMLHLNQYDTLSQGACPTGHTVLAGVTPIYSICPEGATNYNNAGTCCTLTPATNDPATAVGPCDTNGIQGACPAGYACNLSNDPTYGECFPAFDPNLSDAYGPAVEGQCPTGYVAMTTTASTTKRCFPLSDVPGLCADPDQIGPCTNSECPHGYYCNTYADICCQVKNTAPSEAHLHRRPSHRSPVTLVLENLSVQTAHIYVGL